MLNLFNIKNIMKNLKIKKMVRRPRMGLSVTKTMKRKKKPILKRGRKITKKKKISFTKKNK